MKKQIFIVSLAVALAACGGSQKPNDNASTNADSAKTNAATPTAKAVAKAKTINWKKVLCMVDDHGDTMMLNIYDDQNRIIKSLENLENGTPECETVYKYDGKKATVTNSCDEGYVEEITYADDKCEKIIENNGQIYQYDSQERLSKIVVGNNEITYTYETDPKTGNTIININDAGVIHEEHRDKLNRIVYQREIDNLDAYSTKYEYFDDYALATVENTIVPKGDDGVPNPDEAYEDTWQYMVYFLKE